jgi:Uma2 family endonuclease
MSLVAEPQIHRWKKEEYYKMAEIGLFEGFRAELIEGQIIEMSPMGSLHATAVTIINKVLEEIFKEGYFSRIQMPIDAGLESEPEPDIAIISGNIRDFKNSHPNKAELIVEVADTSLEYDRKTKGSIYAKIGIKDYWIFNVKDQQFEVYRGPVEDKSRIYGFGYSNLIIYKQGEFISALAKPEISIPITDLLP